MHVVLGLSDGVDSAVAALLLKRQGHEVTGVHLLMADDTGSEAAEKSAKELGIRFTVLDIREQLKKCVCEHFIDEYLAGRTPSPCPGCNRDVKLPALIETMERLDADAYATGHYVKKLGNRLFMGREDCDQSYMLAKLKTEQLSRLLLPLGEYSKKQVRQIAGENNLSCCSRPDSRENCFIKGMDYVTYIAIQRPEQVPQRGEVLFRGNIVDEHEGIHRYTVGQRWKNDMGERRAYIGRIDASENRITLVLWEELFTRQTAVTHLNFLSGSAPAPEFEGRIRVRHTRWETPACRISLRENGFADVRTQSDLRAPAPGQTAALYMGEELIGGGDVAQDSLFQDDKFA